MKGYRLGKPIGYGASSTILEAWRRMPNGTEKPVAVKQLLPELHENPDIASRFVREANLCMEISQDHPNLVSVYDLHRSKDGQFLMVMERVDGISLDRLPALPWPAIRYVIREIAQGLAFVHAHGVLHRDISPRNVLVTRDGIIKLLDFGLARFLDTPRSDLGFKGTAPYASPEAIQCLDLDASADLYSLAAVGYELINGEAPYGAGNAVLISRRMVMKPIEPLGSDVPEDLASLIMGLLQPWEQRTIRTASQLLEAIGEPIAQPQAIAGIVKETCDAAPESLPEVHGPGEMRSIAPHRMRGREASGFRFRHAALLSMGFMAAALAIYLVLARGQEPETNQPPSPAIETNSNIESRDRAPNAVDEKEPDKTELGRTSQAEPGRAEQAEPGRAEQESDMGPKRADPITPEESNNRIERAPRRRSRAKQPSKRKLLPSQQNPAIHIVPKADIYKNIEEED